MIHTAVGTKALEKQLAVRGIADEAADHDDLPVILQQDALGLLRAA